MVGLFLLAATSCRILLFYALQTEVKKVGDSWLCKPDVADVAGCLAGCILVLES